MQTLSADFAAQHFDGLFEQLITSRKPIAIVSDTGENVILLAEAEWDAMNVRLCATGGAAGTK